MSEGLGSYEVIGTNNSDKLIAGQDIAILTSGVLIKTGQGVLTRGSVIGIETSTGKGILCDSSAADGSEIAKYILAEDNVDTTSADVYATCYKSGIFNRKALTFGVNGAPTTLDDDLRNVNIHLRDELAY